jgi:hypothetical protein
MHLTGSGGGRPEVHLLQCFPQALCISPASNICWRVATICRAHGWGSVLLVLVALLDLLLSSCT